MCSCKSKEVVTKVDSTESIQTETSHLNESTKVDTTKTTYVEQIKDNKVIIETLTIVEYDKESGKPIKETHAKRETRQGIDKVVEETEVKGVIEVSKDSVSQFIDADKKVEATEQVVTTSDSSSFFKWIGIVVGCIIGVLLVYLLNKLRVN